MAAAFLIPFARDFFEFTFLSTTTLLITLAIIAAGILIFTLLRISMKKHSTKILKQI
jgi:hypothetical protein